MAFESQVLEALSRIETGFEKRISAIEYDLNGNGKPGLILDVHDLKNEAAGRKDRAFWVKSLIVSNVVVIGGYLAKIAKLF